MPHQRVGTRETGLRGTDSKALSLRLRREEGEQLFACLWGKGLEEASRLPRRVRLWTGLASGGVCKVEMPYFYDHLGYPSKGESYALLHE